MNRLLVPVMLIALTGFAAEAAAACEDLVRLQRPAAAVTAAQTVAAGAFTPPAAGGRGRGGPAAQIYPRLPAFCRVAIDADAVERLGHQGRGLAAEGRLERNSRPSARAGWLGRFPTSRWRRHSKRAMPPAGRIRGTSAGTPTSCPDIPRSSWTSPTGRFTKWRSRAKAVVEAHYGRQRRSSRTSTVLRRTPGAYRARNAIPADFDGIVAGASTGTRRSTPARIAINRTVNQTPESSIPASKYPMIHQAVLRRVRRADGVRDGVIENPPACRFDYAALACKGADTAACLTPPQVESAKVLISPFKRRPAVLLEGHLWPGAELNGRRSADRSRSATTGRVQEHPSQGSEMGAGHDQHRRRRRARRRHGQRRCDPTNVNLKPFFDRGGKLIMWHGWADPQVPPQNSMIYYNNVAEDRRRTAEDRSSYSCCPASSTAGAARA